MVSPSALTRLAVTANIAAAGLLSAAYAFSHRLFGTADEMAHLDYAYQVWHGRLPVFEEGLALDPGFGFRSPTQWTAHHPPLYYLVEAPVVGPFLDAERYVAAGYAGRAVSALFACALVAAVMWTARVIAARRRTLWLAAGTLAAAHPAVVFMGGVVYNDTMFVTFATLLVGITARMLREGPTWPRLAAFAAFASCALLTRSSAIAVVGICGLVLLIAFLRERRGRWQWVGGLAAAGAVAALVPGWFYLRNYRLTGNLLGTQLSEDLTYLQNRVARPIHEVLLDPNTWWQWHLVWGYGVADSTVFAWVLVGIPLAVAAALAVSHLRKAPRRGDRAVVLLFAGLVVLVVVMQAQYVAVRGGASWRYLMPLVPVTTLAAAWTVTARRRLAPALLSGWVLAAVVPLAIACGRVLVTPEPHSDANVFPGATAAALLLAGMALSTAVVSIVLLPSRVAAGRAEQLVAPGGGSPAFGAGHPRHYD